jgi:hypothetical protein
MEGKPMRLPSQRNAVAKEIRAVLARAFPATQFSVRQSSRARSNRFIVTDGPSEDDVTREIGSLPDSVPFGFLYCARSSSEGEAAR